MNAVKFRSLGIRVRDGAVEYESNGFGRPWKQLGPIAGAHAEVTDGYRVHNVAGAALGLMPVLALMKRTKGACAFIVFADGSVREHKLADKKALAAAKADAIRFNALAAAAPPARPAPAAGQFSAADHERALKAGQAAMSKLQS